MRLYPLVFEPLLKEKVWGGRSLAEVGKSLPSGVLIGESWEVSDLPPEVPHGQSVIANGPLRGCSLHEAITAHHEAIMGAASLTDQGGFPLLIKFLDARENLSVQVHPSAAYVAQHPQAHLKSEAWVVLNALPEAVIYKGLKPQVTREQFAGDITTGRIVDDLITVPVRPGDCHYLPSGTCHALGAGIVVAEIQTASDTTFRVYDWGRRHRELHIEQAMQCIDFGPAADDTPVRGRPIEVDGLRTTPLVKSAFFEIERIDAQADVPLQIVTSGMPMVWMFLHGGGAIETPDAASLELSAGTTVLLPAALKDSVALLRAASSLLKVALPSPLEGLIA